LARPHLVISLIGGISVARGPNEWILQNRRARALLAYLALANNGTTSREHLAGLFWGESSEQRARGSLRQVLLELQAALNTLGALRLRASKLEISLPPGELEVDIVSLAASVERGELPENLTERPRIGETLMAGHDDLTAEFRQWVMQTRQMFQTRLMRGLTVVFDDAMASRELRRRFALEATRQDPTDEVACRAVMRLAAEDGEINTSLRAYETLYHALAEEMDMEPGLETQELVADVKLGRIEAARKSPLAAVISTPRYAMPRVAILPLRILGPDPVPPWLAEGFVEDIVGILADLRELSVISNVFSALHFDSGNGLSRTAERMRAQYCMAGSIRLASGHLHLTMQLVDIADNAVIWNRRFDAQLIDAMALQTQLAASIAHTVVPHVHATELRRVREAEAPSRGAYHLMLEARERMATLDSQEFDKAGILLRRAIDDAPDHTNTHAALAGWYSIRIQQGWARDRAQDASALEEASRQALMLDPGNPLALARLGHNHTILNRDYENAITLFDRTLETSPNNAAAWLWSSPTFAYRGDGKEAVRRAERALTLMPRDGFLFRTYHFLSLAHYTSGSYDDALHWGKLSYDANPNYTSNLRITAAALLALGRKDEALALARRAVALEPDFRAGALAERNPGHDPEYRHRYQETMIELGIPK